MNTTTDFTQVIAVSEKRFAALADRGMTTEITGENANHMIGALIMIAMGGFINRRLKALQDSLVNARASIDSSDTEEAFAAQLIVDSSDEVGAEWQRLAAAFLDSGENLLDGIVPDADTSGLPIFAGQFVDSSLVASSIQLEVRDAAEAAKRFTAKQFAMVGNFIYGILVEDRSALGKIRRDRDIGTVYDQFDSMTLDESIEKDFDIILPVLFYTANQAEALIDRAKELAPISATL